MTDPTPTPRPAIQAASKPQQPPRPKDPVSTGKPLGYGSGRARRGLQAAEKES